MSNDLRAAAIKLAYANPSLRGELLPLLTKQAADPKYQTYVEKKRREGEQPLSKEQWEVKVLGKKPEAGGGKAPEGEKGEKGEKGGASATDKEVADQMVASGWTFVLKDTRAVVNAIQEGKPASKEAVEKAIEETDRWMSRAEEAQYGKSRTQNKESRAYYNELKKHKSQLKKLLSKAEKAEAPKAEKAEDKKPAKTFKKNYRPKMEGVMTKHGLTDDDADQVIKFSLDRPKKGKPQSPEELKRRFMEKAKPETKERMKNMTAAEFMVMLRAILDQEEGEMGKMASAPSLRSAVIKLAHTNPSLRGHLLPLLIED